MSGWLQGLAQVADSAMGFIQADKQNSNQRKQMRLSKALQKELWEETNYPAQVEQMKKAGLNVGMMYEKGGGSASTGSFSTNAPMPDFGGSRIADKLLMSSQMEVQKAQAEKLKEETEGIAYDNQVKREGTVQSEIVAAQNKTAKELQEYYSTLGGKEEGVKAEPTPYQQKLLNDIKIVEENADKAESEARIKAVEARIKEATEEEEKGLIKQSLINAVIDARMKEQGIELSKEQTRKIWHDIWQGWTNAGFNGLGKITNMMFLKNLGSKGNTKTEYYDGSDKSYTKKTEFK